MLSKRVATSICRRNINYGNASISSRKSSTVTPTATVIRQFTYFDDLEVKGNVAVIRLNGPGKMNTISMGMQAEAEKIFNEQVLPNKDIKAVVFISSKSDNFIAGADIDMIKNVKDKSELQGITMKGTYTSILFMFSLHPSTCIHLSMYDILPTFTLTYTYIHVLFFTIGHDFFNKLKKTKIPMIAAINGAALGGGLEWAMYCDYRIATSGKKTVLGLPEVKLGLMPGMAGTYHLPQLIGYAGALDAMLTGKNIRPDKAKKMGLVDLVVDPAVLESVAIKQANGLIDGTVKRTMRKKDIMSRLLEGNA